jgi:hypothetical protein
MTRRHFYNISYWISHERLLVLSKDPKKKDVS